MAKPLRPKNFGAQSESLRYVHSIIKKEKYEKGLEPCLQRTSEQERVNSSLKTNTGSSLHSKNQKKKKNRNLPDQYYMHQQKAYI